MKVNRDVIRMVIRNLIESAGNGANTMSDQERCGLMNLSPLEIEQVVTQAESLVTVDVPGLLRSISQARRDSLMKDLVQAGASNQVLRQIYGVSPRILTRLRREAGISNPGRPRQLSEDEESQVLDYCGETIPMMGNHVVPGRALLMAEWCLEAHRTLGLPFMSLHEWANLRLGGER